VELNQKQESGKMEIITAIRLKGIRVTGDPTISQMRVDLRRAYCARVLGKDAFKLSSILGILFRRREDS
jgi:hypothetical protein